MDDKTPAIDDMVDTPTELAACQRQVSELLADCQPIGDYYEQVNSLAVKHFNVHWWVVVLAAISGMLAVLFAILQLPGERILYLTPTKVEVLEIIAALLALTCVLLGTWAAFDRRWRLNRFLAEQCRLLKFDYLLHAGYWLSRSKEERSGYIKKLLDELARQLPGAPKKWALRELKLVPGNRPKVGALTPSVLMSLKQYYITKRLGIQKAYFSKEALRRETWEKYTKHIAPLCFFLSVGAACAHFVWEIAHHKDKQPVAADKDNSSNTADHGVMEIGSGKAAPKQADLHRPDIVSSRLLLAAACLPVFGAAWRTFRGANEFGRNTIRYVAMETELDELGTQLEQADSPEDTLECLWHIERALDSEHRSWTRLMIEAEWFG